MTFATSSFLAALGTVVPALALQPSSGLDFAALAVLAAVLFKAAHDITGRFNLSRLANRQA